MGALMKLLAGVAHRALVLVGLRRKPLTAQQIFDKVAKHLFAQGERAVSESGTCEYRSAGGNKCAVGVLIPYDVYDPKMEGDNIDGVWHFDGVEDLFAPDTRYLLSSLQVIHDDLGSEVDGNGHRYNWQSTKNMRAALARVASDFKLDDSILDRLSFKDR